MASDLLYYVEHPKPAYSCTCFQHLWQINGWHAINHSTCLLTVMIINITNSTDDYLKEDHRSYIRNFCSCKKKAFFLFATAKVAYITAMIFLQIILYSAVHIYDFHIFIISVLMMVMILSFCHLHGKTFTLLVGLPSQANLG